MTVTFSHVATAAATATTTPAPTNTPTYTVTATAVETKAMGTPVSVPTFWATFPVYGEFVEGVGFEGFAGGYVQLVIDGNGEASGRVVPKLVDATHTAAATATIATATVSGEDHAFCDVVEDARHFRGDVCVSYGDFDLGAFSVGGQRVAQNCLNDIQWTLALIEAGWPQSLVNTAKTVFSVESRGCLDMVDGNAVCAAGIHWLGWTVAGWEPDRIAPFPDFADKNPYDPVVCFQLAYQIYLRSGWESWAGHVLLTPAPAQTTTISVEPIVTRAPEAAPATETPFPESTLAFTNAIAYWSLESAEPIIGRPTTAQWRAVLSVRVPTDREYDFSMPFLVSAVRYSENQEGDDFYRLVLSDLACGQHYSHKMIAKQQGANMVIQKDKPPYSTGNVLIESPCDE